MSEFSMELNEDQITLRDWVHGFAEQQMRPIAAEWDEREETPWPFIQEAAKIGIYSLDFLMNAISDPTGSDVDDRPRRTRLGRRGLVPVAHGHDAWRRCHRRERHPRTADRVGAPLLRHAR